MLIQLALDHVAQLRAEVAGLGADDVTLACVAPEQTRLEAIEALLRADLAHGVEAHAGAARQRGDAAAAAAHRCLDPVEPPAVELLTTSVDDTGCGPWATCR
jgi:hypothetical protein